MHFLEGLLMLLVLPLALASAGSWLVTPLTSWDAGRRLALAVLAGLGVLLLAVSWVNLFLPLSGWGAALAAAPIVVPLLVPSVRRRFLGDLWTAGRGTGAKFVFLGTAVFLGLLLWPMIADPSLVYFDGTSNHDSFFWISGAEYLKRFNYAGFPPPHLDRPFFNSASAILTLRPSWGRMGSEGLLALVSSLAGAAPVKVYLYATAALFIPWISGCYLLIRTFITDRLHGIALLSLGLLQPIFVFFHSNSNLPNLVGTLAAPLLLIGAVHILERRSEPAEPRWPAIAWCALGLHGLLCSYPEMLPFVLLPCGLLGLRGWWGAPRAQAWRQHGEMALGLALGLLLNPATTIRGYYGFMSSFSAARADEAWGHLFERLLPAEYVPALTSLIVAACGQLGAFGGTLLSVFLVVMLIYAIRAARDGIGAGCILSGSMLLLMYTIATDFSYGWQKTVQFGGPAIAAIFPTGILALLPLHRLKSVAWRTPRLPVAAAAVLIGFYGFSTGWGIIRTYFWTDHKAIRHEHLDLREFSEGPLQDARILIVSESFAMPFFHGMWATYALPASDLLFSPRDPEAGGYVRGTVDLYQHGETAPPDAVMVSREWAETIDASSPRLLVRPHLVLLRESNQVLAWDGVAPDRGLPEIVSETMRLEVWPHHDATFTAELEPRDVRQGGPADVAATVVANGITRQHGFRGPAPWRVILPLSGGTSNEITVHIPSAGAPREGEFPLRLRSIRIEDGPDLPPDSVD